MSIFAQAGVPPSQVKDRSPIPKELELFARIEGLVGEEAALLAIPREERDKDQHERLGAVSEELDRIWERLRERPTASESLANRIAPARPGPVCRRPVDLPAVTAADSPRAETLPVGEDRDWSADTSGLPAVM